MITLRRKTVDQIIKPITNIVDRLHTRAAVNTGAADRYTAMATRLVDRANESRAEAEKATTAAGKIASLLG